MTKKTEKKYIVKVDENGNDLGLIEKVEGHLGPGVLHSAFSVFVFNDSGELLVTKRSQKKMLWPLHWSNTCCSHPRRGEGIAAAGKRRLGEELGFTCDLKELYKFKYQAEFKKNGKLVGSENELCSVLIGKSNKAPDLNSQDTLEEISDFRYLDLSSIIKEFERDPESHTPWFKMEVEKLMSDYSEEINRLFL